MWSKGRLTTKQHLVKGLARPQIAFKLETVHVCGTPQQYHPLDLIVTRARKVAKVIGVGFQKIYVYMFVDQKKLNCTLAIDSPFQTFAVGLLVEFID